MEDIFEINDGQLVAKDVKSTAEFINHYFGLHMSTRFVQQYGGHVSDEEGAREVTYNFSGDDDVWVFIDGVLVGDLGGNHDRSSLQINFSTGEVVVYWDKNNNNIYDPGETTYRVTTIKDQFEAADADTSANSFSGNTFADGTVHTLDFFYMERGNYDSNLSLKYNMAPVTESSIQKVDESGDPLPNVTFDLYEANENYQYNEDTPFYTGETDGNGTLAIKDGKGNPIQMAELHATSDHWVLVEKSQNGEYRLPGEIHLYFPYDSRDLLLCENPWTTGAYAEPQVTVLANKDFTDQILQNGKKLLGVVLKKVGDDKWLPVSGNIDDGWTLGEDATDNSIIKAAEENNTFFEVGSTGAYQLDLTNLPGDIRTYQYFSDTKDETELKVQYKLQYYTLSADGQQLEALDTTDTNTYLTRIFSVVLDVVNVLQPAPTLRKTSDGGTPIAGVTFELYETGSNFATTGLQSIRTLTTDKNGEFVVDEDENGDGALAQGYYVLVETDAPDDYIVAETPVQIVVNNDGVFVNAGTADDNVKVESGLGTLVATMRSFAVDDDVDTTLHDVKAQSQTGEYNEADGTITWTTDDPATELHLQYDDAAKDGTYKVTPGVSDTDTYTADAGWTRLNITQCTDLHTDHTDANKQDLGNQSLNALFTGETVIHVTNSKPEPTPSTPEPPDEEPPDPTPTPQNTPAPEPTPVPEQTPVPEPTPVPVAAKAAPAVTIPQTSDDMPVGALTATAAAAAAAFAALLVVRKRRHGKD